MHVSCRATRSIVELFESLGLDAERLVVGTGLSIDRLRDERARLTWDEFASVLDNVQRMFPEPEALERVALGLSRVPTFARLYRVGALLVTPRRLYWLLARWIGPSMFPVVRATLRDQPDGRLSLTLDLPAEHRPSIPFFRICKGGIASMPRFIGLPAAHVEATIGPHRAVYSISLPELLPVWSRLRRAVGGSGTAENALAEIERYRQELQESYEALLRSRQDFRALLEKMSDSVCVHREGRVVWGNHAFVHQLGRSRAEEVVGMSILDDIVHPEDRAELARTMRVATFSGEEPPRKFRVIRPDGSWILIEISEPQMVEFDGAPARLVVGRDITERRRQESAMIVADRMASIGVLAAGVAHEINNPLAYAHASLVVAERELARGGDPAALAESIAAARDGTDRVRAIVRDLKTLSRGDEEHLEAVDLRTVVESALTLAKKEIERRARLNLDLPRVPLAHGDRARLGQVVLNLLLNAADSIAEGAPEENEIAVSTSTVGDRIVLEVRDTGSGIKPDDLRRIFDPFFTTKEPGTGTGLGLSICHRIVSGLGGRIDVESTVGKGTTFRVTLVPSPEGMAEARISTPPPPPECATKEREHGRGRVLVIDDEPRLLSVLTTMISEHHEVVTMADARVALDRLRTDDSFDVILCDLMMAGMTGMDLYDALRSSRPGLERRMVFMTGGTFTARAREFLSSTPQRWLEKPFEMERLLDVIRERLGTHAVAQRS
ncbi:MAG: ATP-binding protein [Polyangiales bacterium]